MSDSNMPPLETEQDDVDRYFKRAKQLALEEYKKLGYNMLTENDIYIVWFSKILQNWKALVGATVNDGRYIEITYNGDRLEAYVDVYRKATNEIYTDLLVFSPPPRSK